MRGPGNASMPFQSIPAGAGRANNLTLRSILRISMPVSVLLYCAAFHYSYANWMSKAWGYMGLTYKSPDLALLAISYILAATMCAVSPTKLRRPSHAIYWVLFFTVYIPGLLVPLFLQLDNGMALFGLQLSLTGGMLAIAVSYRFTLVRLRRYPASPQLFWLVFAVVFCACNAAVLFAYRNNLHLASLKDIYSIRHQGASVTEDNPVIGYVIQLLGSVMDPLLISYGLANRRKKLAGLGILGEVIVYSASSAKASILTPVFVIAFYYTIKRDQGGWVPKLGVALAGICFTLTTAEIGRAHV